MARKKSKVGNKIWESFQPPEVEDLEVIEEVEVPEEDDDTLDCTEFMGGNPYSYLDGPDIGDID